jgi:hypothetical protein
MHLCTAIHKRESRKEKSTAAGSLGHYKSLSPSYKVQTMGQSFSAGFRIKGNALFPLSGRTARLGS